MHNRPEWRLFTAGLALTDLVCLTGAFGAAAWLAALPSLGGHTGDYYGIFIVLMVPVFAIFFVTQGLYDPQNLLAGTREYASVFRACIYGLVTLILLSYAVHRHISREWIVFSGTLAIASVGWSRFAMRRLAHRLRRSSKGEWLIPLYSDLKRHLVVDAEVAGLGNELLAQRFVFAPPPGLRWLLDQHGRRGSGDDQRGQAQF